MGLFDFLKKITTNTQTNASKNTSQSIQFRNEVEREMYAKNLNGYREMKDYIDYQNALLNRVNVAQEKFKEDGNLEAVIKELEYAFIESNPPCESSQNMDLVNYYLKAGQNDKAWGYSNRLLTKQEASVDYVRFAQARILKKEKRWVDAIEMYMLGYLAKASWNSTFKEEMFTKDIKSSANKLGWDENIVNHLSQIVKRQVTNRNYNEALLVQEFRKFCSSIK